MPRSQGHNASMQAMASAAVSLCGQVGSCTGATDLAFRRCRFRARTRPPRRPMLRHWSIVRLNRILPSSRFMAPRFIDRAALNLKRHFALSCRFTRSEGEGIRSLHAEKRRTGRRKDERLNAGGKPIRPRYRVVSSGPTNGRLRTATWPHRRQVGVQQQHRRRRRSRLGSVGGRPRRV